MRIWLVVAFALFHAPAFAASLDAEAINTATWTEKARTEKKAGPGGLNPSIVRLQILLDRANFSPGEIDGRMGENVEKAIAAYAEAHDAPSAGMSQELWRRLTEASGGPAIVEHTISAADVKGPFVDKVPAKMEDMKDLPALSYTSVKEKLAEQFHMSPELLEALNKNKRFDQAGETILVANVSREKLAEKVARIEIDKARQTMKVFGRSQKLLAVYPVTAGSTEKPAPSGVLKVTTIARNPTYHYNPAYAFKSVKTQERFTIKPGPNNPVGTVWIGLNKEGYGLHGTPDPSKVSKSETHGCIRLTNWDAQTLASALQKGTPVEFIGDESERKRKGKRQRR